jgi:hypothetical protein
MLDRISQRLLTLLQLTRMALVFTAVSNSLCSYLLAVSFDVSNNPQATLWSSLNWGAIACVALVSIGLYGFGMSLNDIIDRRRDRQIASHRPLPSGRIRVLTAHLVCAALILMALSAGAVYAKIADHGWQSFVLLLWTGFLITFYDFAGKYLVAPGLLTLGFIRLFHAIIPAPQLACVWHPLLLFTHVAILSTIAYHWEQKRPPLTPIHWVTVFTGVLGVDLLAVALVWTRRPDSLRLVPGLLLPVVLAGVFAFLAWRIWATRSSTRQAGQTLMLAGLLWLIVYDAAFALVYLNWKYATVVLLLLPVSYLLVQSMRWWAKLVMISQPPEFKRMRTGPEIPK